MTPLRIILAALGTTVALVAAGCGGGSQSVPDNAVAVVNGTVITKSDLDTLVQQTKNNYKATSQQFPKAGTPEYQNLQAQWVQYLVQTSELRQAAADEGITVTPKEVDKSEKGVIDAQFGGKRSEYVKTLKSQGLTPADYRPVLERQVLTTKLYDKVTKDVKVTDQDVLQYYSQHSSDYPESRDVRHILLSVTNPAGCKPGQDAKCKVDYIESKAEADKIEKQLRAGVSFALLAKKYSQDPGSKNSGGKLTIQRGQTVPEFEKAAFALKVGAISQPVKTVYGYHVIEALSPVKGSFEGYKNTIRQAVLSQKKNSEMQTWVEKLTSDYKSKIKYAAGFEPPAVPEVPTTATE